MSSKESGKEEVLPVTVVISRRVRKGCEKQFEELSSKLTEAASVFPGYQGANMFRPSTPTDPEYRIIFKFDTKDNLEAWLTSDERNNWLRDIESLLVQPSTMEVTSGLVTWFSFHGENPVQPPPKYKMALVSWLAVFPTVTIIFWLFGKQLAGMPLLPRILILSAVVMILMTYVLMPRFTKWFSFWLYPKEKRDIR